MNIKFSDLRKWAKEFLSNPNTDKSLFNAECIARAAEQRLRLSELTPETRDKIDVWIEKSRHTTITVREWATLAVHYGMELERARMLVAAKDALKNEIQYAVSLEREMCARIIEAQDVDPAIKNRMACAIRSREENKT